MKRISYHKLWCGKCRKDQPHEVTLYYIVEEKCIVKCQICKQTTEAAGFGKSTS